MSLLNSLFNRGILGAKCKTCLTLAISRIKHLRNKRELQLKQMRKEIAQFLQTNQEAIARIRVEHIIREMNILAAYEILELFCEFILARVPILETQRECPPELQEAIASIIFAAPRCSDLPELVQIRNLFSTKYGKEFVLTASELRPDSGVNRAVIEKLSVKAPATEIKLKLLKEIAQEYNIEWDSSNTEAAFSKKHEDLLDGSNQVFNNAKEPQASGTGKSVDFTPHKELHSSDQSPNSAETVSFRQKSLVAPIKSGQLDENNHMGDTSFDNREKNSHSSDVLERARAAIVAAERASAAAWMAAKLVNANKS